MNLITISLAYLKARKLNTLLNILLLALGVATIVLLLLATTQLDQRMRDALLVGSRQRAARAAGGNGLGA